MSLKIANEFLEKLSKLTKDEQKRTRKTLDVLSLNPKSSSISLHRLNNDDCESKFWSARVTDDLRIILWKESDVLFVLHVDHHDAAYEWASNRNFIKNYMGSYFVYEKEPKYSVSKVSESTRSGRGLLEYCDVKKKHLVEFGINEVHAKNIIKIDDEEVLMDYIEFLPDEIQEAIIDLVSGAKSLQEVYNELKYEENLYDIADDPNSRRRFIDSKELEHYDLDELLNDFENWKLFLHPYQSKLVNRSFNGPVLVEGGPGTGKTVVGVHRAIYIAENIYKGGNIYYVTFNKTLPLIIKDMISKLKAVKRSQAEIIVVHVDSLFISLLSKQGYHFHEYNEMEVRKYLYMIYEEIDDLCSLDFFVNEYFEIIQKYQIKDLDEYLSISRSGRKESLQKKKRESLWSYFEKIIKFKQLNQIYDFEDRAALLGKLVDEEKIKPFMDSLIIDEAQDLSISKIKTLAKLVRHNQNNIMLLSDQNQRIYSLASWKGDTSLRVTGRTYHLSLNYRTTKEIKKYADLVFNAGTIKEQYYKEYKSILSGPEPIVKELETIQECYEYLINLIDKLKNIIDANEIGIITNKAQIGKIEGVLEVNNIPYIRFNGINTYEELKKGVNVLSLHLAKGLEYKAVIIFNISEDNPELFNENIDDDYYYSLKYQQYECLKYVAATRARDFLYIVREED